MDMVEDGNGVLHPGQEVVRDIHATLRQDRLPWSNTVLNLYDDQGPLDMNLNTGEPIDDDEALDALLAASDL